MRAFLLHEPQVVARIVHAKRMLAAPAEWALPVCAARPAAGRRALPPAARSVACRGGTREPISGGPGRVRRWPVS